MRSFFYPKLAVSNIKKNGKFYFPYLLTCIGTIALFYILGFITFHPGLESVPGTEIMMFILNLGMIVVGIFAAIFLYYTNSFLMKRRQKELGLFYILGMEKSHLSRVMLYETIFIALASLLLGVGCGLLFSKLILLLLCKLTGLSTAFTFFVSIRSITITVAGFGVIFLLILASNLLKIRKSNPVELLHGGNVGEKEPKTNWIVAALGILLTGGGYFIAQSVISPVEAMLLFFVAVILVILGTFCLFTAGSIALLKLLRRNKRYYYHPKHFISVSGMIYRMKQNAAGLANICILSTMVLVILSTTICLYTGMEEQLNLRYPHDFTVRVYGNPSEQLCQSFLDAAESTVKEQGRTTENFSDYHYMEFAVRKEGTELVAQLDDQYALLDLYELVCIPIEDYNRMTGQSITLADNEVMTYSQGKGLPQQFTIFQKDYQIIKTLDQHPISGVFNTYVRNLCFLVGNQATMRALYEGQLQAYGEQYASKFQYTISFDLDAQDAEKERCIAALSESFQELRASFKGESMSYSYENKLAGVREGYVLYGGFLFIGIFLGLLFLMATVLIIYYKQMSEGYDDRARFEIMKQVGMGREEIWKTIRSQIVKVFFLPLFVAATHVAFAFKMITKLLFLLQLQNVTLFFWSTVGTFVIFAVIYSIVYHMTAKTYYKIVS